MDAYFLVHVLWQQRHGLAQYICTLSQKTLSWAYAFLLISWSGSIDLIQPARPPGPWTHGAQRTLMRNRIMLTLRVKQITCISFRKKLIWRKLIIQYKRNLSRKFKWKRRKKPCWLLRCKSRKMRRKSRDNNKKRRSRTRF